MKLTLKDIKDLITSVKKLVEIELPFKEASSLAEIIIYLEKYNLEIEKNRVELVKKYGEQIDGNWLVKQEFISNFVEEWVLYLTETVVDYPFDTKIVLSEKQKEMLSLSAQEYIVLKNMILE